SPRETEMRPSRFSRPLDPHGGRRSDSPSGVARAAGTVEALFMFRGMWTRLLGIATALATCSGTAQAAWLWDQNHDEIDDRMQAVESQGLATAHVGNVLSGRLRFAVLNTAASYQ